MIYYEKIVISINKYKKIGCVKLNIKKLIENSNLNIKKENILYNEPMKNYITFKVGGPAECLIKVYNIEELKEILSFVKENSINLTIIGNGSNLLILDGGIKGITLLMKMDKIDIEQRGEKFIINVQSGVKMGKLAQILQSKEVSGFEELSGIPGTIGGAVIMNAGAHGKEMKHIVTSVKCMDYDGLENDFKNEDLNFEYRNSLLRNGNYIITDVSIELKKGNKDEIKGKMKEYSDYRKTHQPIEYPSAGSTFKRGKDFITAKLIDEAGLKGYTIGGAQVSTKHAGFVINKGEATAKDILELTNYIKNTIKEKFDKEIELEIEIIGEL